MSVSGGRGFSQNSIGASLTLYAPTATFRFGLTLFQLCKLLKHLRIPPRLCPQHRHIYGGEEFILIYLFHVRKGIPFTEIARHVFVGDSRYFLSMFDLANTHLYSKIYNKIAGTSLLQ